MSSILLQKMRTSCCIFKDMTGKMKAMVAERLKDRKASNAEIIKRAGYKVNGIQTASQIYLENMKKPEIASKLQNVVDEMEDVLTTTVRRYKSSNDVREVTLANDNAKWIHDKVHGKATQHVEQHSTSVNLNLSLNDIAE
jgi:hypothetical protein